MPYQVTGVSLPSRLNVREGPSATAPIVGKLYPDAIIDPAVFENGWFRIFGNRYVLAKYLRQISEPAPIPVPIPTPTPTPTPGARRHIGVHIGFNGDKGDIVGVARRLAEAGRPIPLIVVVSDPGLCKTIKEVSPLTFIIYRWVEGVGDPGPFGEHESGPGWSDGASWFDELWRRNSQAFPYADAYQNWNECSFAGNTQSVAYAERVNEIELAHMRRANERGVKVTFGNHFVGTPEQRHINALKPAFGFAEQYGHVFCYHAYSSANNDATFAFEAEYFALRWKEWVADYPNLRVILGEASHFHAPRFRGAADMLNMMTELNNLIDPIQQTHKAPIQAAYWSVRVQNDPNYTKDDITAALQDYEWWMMA